MLTSCYLPGLAGLVTAIAALVAAWAKLTAERSKARARDAALLKVLASLTAAGRSLPTKPAPDTLFNRGTLPRLALPIELRDSLVGQGLSTPSEVLDKLAMAKGWQP